MERREFVAIMPYICADLASVIAEKEGLQEADAISKLYSSRLYTLLEREETKVWQYGTPMLYELYSQGEKTGRIQFPDV